MKPLRADARRLIGAVALAGLVMAACGDDSDEPEESTPTTEAERTEEAATDDAVVDDAAADEGGESEDQQVDSEVAEPGTALAIGEAATVPVAYNDEEGTVSMTVVGIEEGDIADMAEFDLDEGAEGMVPYYVTFSFTKVSGGALSGAGPEADAAGLLDDGTPAQELSLIGSFEPCDTMYAEDEFDEGESYETCRVFIAEAGTPVTSAAFFGDYDGPYYEAPITWGP